MSSQDPYSNPAYGTPPPYDGHPSFAPYGTAPSPQYRLPVADHPLAYYGGGPTYAHWGLRVGAMLLDLFTLIPYWMGAVISSVLSTPGYDRFGEPTTTTTPAGAGALVLGVLLSLGLWVWNRGIRQARTGQSWGKKVVGLRLLHASTGSTVSVTRALLRDLAHYFDCLFLCLGFWFPLWDARRQTFADKLAKTVSVT